MNINSTSSKGKKLVDRSATDDEKQTNMLPKGIQWNFHVTSDMQLDLVEAQIIAYVYHPNKDKEEPLVSSNGIIGYRSDFDTLAPGMIINDKIMTLICRRSTWIQNNYNRGAVWYLPPSFAEDVFSGMSTFKLIDRYFRNWMEPNSNLKYIYVPIKTKTGHWFLMVISLELQMKYYLDSFCPMEDIECRSTTMSILSKSLNRMVRFPYYGTTFDGRSIDFSCWPLEQAKGIPNVGHSDNAAAWLIKWIDMGECFTPNIQGELLENNIRIRAATRLLLEMYNELKTTIEVEAKENWRLINS